MWDSEDTMNDMTEFDFREHIPRAVVVLLNVLFTEGHTVNDYKVVGNKHGHSITFHIVSPSGTPEMSPGKYRSPSSCHYDLRRHQEWQCGSSIAPGNSEQDPVSGPYNREGGCEAGCSSQSENENGLKSNIMTTPSADITDTRDVTRVDGIRAKEINNNEDSDKCASIESRDQLHLQIDNIHDDETMATNELTGNDETIDTKQPSPELDKLNSNDTPSDVTELGAKAGHHSSPPHRNKNDNKPDNDEKEYMKRLLDTTRNKTFTKIVHDRRYGHSKVYGQTDDLIIAVDEQLRKYQTYAMHDVKDNKKCREIFDLLHEWPATDEKACEYGLLCLNKLLPTIVHHESGAADAAK